MAIFRINKNKDYTTISNYHLKDKNLTLKAKGLLSVMLSLPENWDYSVRGLSSICKETKDTINGILNELEQNNYLVRKRIYTNGKISEWEYNIYECNDLHPKKQDIENQDIGFYDNNKYTKELNTKENNKYIYSRVIEYLNSKIGTSYKSTTKSTQSHIKARLEEGFSEDDFIKVIDKKVKEWKGTKWEKFLRPETLFSTKFESYLNQKEEKENEWWKKYEN